MKYSTTYYEFMNELSYNAANSESLLNIYRYFSTLSYSDKILSSNQILINVVDLLNKGVDPNYKDVDGKSPLHYAAINPWPNFINSSIDLLVNKGANINAVDNEGRTPLHYVAMNSLDHTIFPLINCLVNNGANIDLPDIYGRTPLHYAVMSTLHNTISPLVDSLISKGADVNAVDDEGNTPLHLIGASNNLWGANNNLSGLWMIHSNIIDKLLANGANPNIKNNKGNITVAEIISNIDNIDGVNNITYIYNNIFKKYNHTYSFNELLGNYPFPKITDQELNLKATLTFTSNTFLPSPKIDNLQNVVSQQNSYVGMIDIDEREPKRHRGLN